MRVLTRCLVSAVGAGLLSGSVLVGPVSAATATYEIAGAETAASFAQSTFAGTTTGASKAVQGEWSAVVLHDLGGITGGTFSFASATQSMSALVVSGTFGPSTGTCSKRTIAIHGVLSDGGTFDLTLTRRGTTKSGVCVVKSATVRGTAALVHPG